MEKKQVISVKISPELWKMARKFAIDKNITFGQLVEMAVIHEMQRK